MSPSSFQWTVAAVLALVTRRTCLRTMTRSFAIIRKQQRQAETDHVVRRITTMLRAELLRRRISRKESHGRNVQSTLTAEQNQMSDVIRQSKPRRSRDESNRRSIREGASHRAVLRSLHILWSADSMIKSPIRRPNDSKHAKGQQLHLKRAGRSVTSSNQAARFIADMRLLIAKHEKSRHRDETERHPKRSRTRYVSSSSVNPSPQLGAGSKNASP